MRNVHMCFDMDLVCIVMYYISGHKRKALTIKLQNVYTYRLVWKKTGLHAKFQVHRCFDLDLVCIIVLSGHIIIISYHKRSKRVNE